MIWDHNYTIQNYKENNLKIILNINLINLNLKLKLKNNLLINIE